MFFQSLYRYIVSIVDLAEAAMDFAGLLVLVGGACVSIYSHNQYQSSDLDFVNPPVSIGHEAIHKFNTFNTPIGSFQLLSPTDCVKDRLASFFYWNDFQGFEKKLKEFLVQIKKL